MPGPAPKKDARRRNKRPDWLTLPAAGRTGRAPKWPMPRNTDRTAAKRETELWRDLWATPQAFAWEQLGWTRVVARYCRLVIICEGPESTAALLGEVRQLEDRLGLTPMAMRRLQWEVGETAAAPGSSSGGKVAVLDEYRALYA